MNKKAEILENVNPDVYKKVDGAAGIYQKARTIDTKLKEISEAADALQSIKEEGGWRIIIDRNGGADFIRLNNKDVLEGDIKEATIQYLTLLESIFHTELEETIKQFNQSLKSEEENGKDTEESV
jgi:DNA primase large subunit